MTLASRSLKPAAAIKKRRNDTPIGPKTPSLSRENNGRISEREQRVPMVAPADKISVRSQNAGNADIIVPAEKISVRGPNAENEDLIVPAHMISVRDKEPALREPAKSKPSVSPISTTAKASTSRKPGASPSSAVPGPPPSPLSREIDAARLELDTIRGAISTTERTLRNLENNIQDSRGRNQQVKPEAESKTIRGLCHAVKSDQDRLDKLFRQLDRVAAAVEAPPKERERSRPKAKETQMATQRETGGPESSAMSTVMKRKKASNTVAMSGQK